MSGGGASTTLPPRFVARLAKRTGRWSPPAEALMAALERAVTARFGDDPKAPASVERFVDGLHAEDLALAVACLVGDEGAWSVLMTEVRPKLYAAARAIAGEESMARELADELWAELWGLDERDGTRRSLLTYFHGRSQLTTWLRAILARRHVDLRRRTRRLDPIDDVAPARLGTLEAPTPEPGLERWLEAFREALTTELAELEPNDRLRLTLYHLRGMKLAELARTFREHESTVSRKLDRVRRTVRKGVERRLAREHGLSEDQIRTCSEHVLEGWPIGLAHEAIDGKNREPARSKDEG